MNQKIFKVFTVLMLIASMTMANFLLFGYTVVSYAADSVGKGNCSINAYFIDGQGNKTDKLETEISKTDLKLGLEIQVNSQGYFNGEILLNNSNFKLNTDVQNEHINSITEDKITLNQINAGGVITLELGITPNKDDLYDLSNLNKATEIEMTGNYVAGNNKTYKIDDKQNVTLSFKSPYASTDVDKLNLVAENVTNKVYKINGEDKRLVQVELKSNLQGNSFPVKDDKFTLDVPDGVEDVMVGKRETLTTSSDSKLGQKWDKQNNKLEVTLTNNANSDNKVQWNKSGNDRVIVTFVMSKDSSVNVSPVNVTETLDLYDSANTAITKNTTVSDFINKDGAISLDLGLQDGIYKGNLYYGENTDYQETETVDVRYPQIAKDIKVTTGNSTYSDESSANSRYVKTTINKKDLSNVLGENGTLTITDGSGNVLGTATKQSIQDSGDNVELNYDEQGGIIIEIQNAENEGELKFVNSKKLSETNYSKDQMKGFTSLKTTGKLNADENVDEKQAEGQATLNEPSTYATISSNTSELSTLNTNSNVEFNVILKTDDIKYDLYKNPSIEVVMPKEISSIDAQVNPVFIDGFTIAENTITKNAEGNNVIKISLAGEQKTHSNNISEGIILNINANITIDKTVSTRDSKIVLHYRNENDGNQEHIQELPMKIKSKDGLLFYDKVENYNSNGDVIESISNETENGKIDIGVDAKAFANDMLFVNNTGANIENAVITLQNDNNASLSLPVTAGVQVQGADSKVSYSQDGANWTEDASTLESIKAYKVEIASLPADGYAQIQSDLNIPANLDYSKEAKIVKDVKYTVNGENLEQQKILDLKTDEKEVYQTNQVIGENTQTGETTQEQANQENPVSESNPNTVKEEPQLNVSIQTSLGDKTLSKDDAVYGGEIVKNTILLKNTSNVEVKNIKVQAKQENATLYDLVEIKGINPAVTEDVNEEVVQHNYGDVDSNEKTFDTIESIAPGETKELTYEARVSQKDGKDTYGTVTISADDLEESKIDTIKNQIKKGKVQLTLQNSYNEELEKYDGESVNTRLYVKNTDNDKLKNVKVDVQLPENYYIDTPNTDISFYKDDQNWEDVDEGKVETITYNEKSNIISFNITELNANEQIVMIMEPIAKNTDTNAEYQIAEVSSKALVGNDEYVSNNIQKAIYSEKQDVKLEYSIKDAKKEYKNGDNVTFVIKAHNTGKEDGTVDIFNKLTDEFNVTKVTKINDNVSTDITSSVENGYIGLMEESLGAGKDLEIDVNTSVKYDDKENKNVTNKVELGTGTSSAFITKNVETKLVGTSNEENTNTNNTNTENGGNTENNNTNTSEENENTENTNNGSQENSQTSDDDVETKISGVVWNDRDHNGQKDELERGIQGVEVRLTTENGTFVKDDNGNVLSTKTNSIGEYSFNVKQGRYIVVFLYDNQNYATTEYKKQGVSEEQNSDAISKEIAVDGNTVTAGITDVIDTTSGNAENVDVGLYKRQKFDLKLDKFITKVSVQNTEGTKQYEFGREKLAKVEIRAKQFVGSTVAVEYQIEVTNEGEIDGFVNDVIDYIPDGFEFDSNLNKNWYMGTDKKLHNTSLENETIKAGETKTLTLVLSKTMKESEGQTLVNTAEIQKASNKENVNDIDSTPGNKKDGEDDINSATLLVTISTGIGRIFTGSVLIVLAIAVAIVVVMRRKGAI